MKSNLYPAQLETQSTCKLKINITSILASRPITGATIRISYTGEPDKVIEEVTTDLSGQTDEISLPAPDESLSLEPSAKQPFFGNNP